jgi:tripartite-type tricarboxylate transporter receptor subunit TctC
MQIKNKTGRGRSAILALAVAAAAGLGCSFAAAQPFPSRPVKIVVPNAPGGLSDTAARLVSPGLAERLGQPVVIENRPGAGGTIGTASVARAAPDGYTLIAVFDAHASNPHLFRSLDYDGIADFAPVSLLVRGPLVLVVHPRVAAKSAMELAALARARPGAINFAAVGPGSPARLLAEYFKLAAGIEFTVVPYKGAAPALTDLVSGEVDAMFATVPSISSHLKAGRLRALAVTSAQATPALPGVPPMNDAYPGYVAEAWVGLLAPARTAPEILARLHDDTVQVLAAPELRERFAAQGLETVGSTPAELERWMRVETERWGRVIREQKIRIE